MSPKSLHFSHVQLSATLWTVVCQASLSMDSLGKDTGVVAMTSPGDLPHPGFKPKSPASVGRFFTTIYNKVLFSRFLNVRFSGIHIVVRPPPPSISGTFLLSQTETVSIKPLLPSPTLWSPWLEPPSCLREFDYSAAAAAAAESLQSCPTLCDPIDCSPPGSAIPGILQARTLEWVAIWLL